LAAQDPTQPGAQTPPDQSAPSSQSQPEPSPAAPPTPEQSTPQSEVPPPPTPNPASDTRKTVNKKKPGAKTSDPGHKKVVVRNGGAKDQSPQLAPGMSKQQELHSRETTARLWATTDANLKIVAGRQMTPAQQSVFDQIHTYLRQSKDASDSGDLARAHTLAYKAHLLSDELKK